MRRALLVSAPALIATACVAGAPLDRLLGRVPDDAAFYLVYARNLARGAGLTFDGVDPSTGAHPLWLALVALAVPLEEPTFGLRALVGLHGVVIAIDAVLLDAVLRASGAARRGAGLLAAAAGAWGCTAYGLGMESGLVTLFALAAAWIGLATRVARGAAWLVGLLLAFTRVDALPLLLGAGWRAPQALAGGLAGVVATLVGQYAWTDAWGSSAARIKAMGSVAERLGRLDPSVVWRHTPGVAVVSLVLLALAAQRGRAPKAPLLLAVCGGGVWITTSYLMNNLVGPWYHLPVTWLLLAAAGAALGTRTARGPLDTALRLALGWTLLRGLQLPAPGLHGTVRAAAGDLAQVTTAADRVIAEDFPGFLSWFSERRVLPADGLAAGVGYREALASGDALAWWQRRGATHWMVTRRREAWLSERPLVDRVAPPFLPVPATPVPLDVERRCSLRVDVESRRVFAVYALDQGRCSEDPPPRR